MPYFVVNYDLKESDNYQPLIKEIERLGGVRALESFWLIELNNTAEQVRDHYKPFRPSPEQDKLMVVEFSVRPRFTRAFSAAVDWIKSRFG
jgi:hypothetical protein